ncbi:MAG: hypothetical protein LBS60_00290 [Deltaproteobacteria bacterium]|jgi:hypothetical protein|nr:hypothetical protein [Deltaproteobacteria bacterium]
MKNPNTIKDEIDAIRIALYEKTKDMTIKEFNEFVEKRTAPIIKKFGFKVASKIETKAPDLLYPPERPP